MGNNPIQKRQAISETIDFDKTIHTIRGQRVMLDSDLAILFGVPTKRVNEAVKRNPERFPFPFMFVLTRQELTNLRSQFATSSALLDAVSVGAQHAAPSADEVRRSFFPERSFDYS